MMIMAAASVDDVYVITLFSSALLMVSSGTFEVGSLLSIPVSIVTGLLAGWGMSILVGQILKHFNFSNVMKLLVILASCFVFVGAESWIQNLLPYSSLLSVIGMCAFLANQKDEKLQVQIPSLKNSMNSLWQIGEMFLFVMVAAGVDLAYASANFAPIICCIVIGLLFRMAGTFLAVASSNLNRKEKLFCMIAYCPKATVQAGIGATALGMGLACGNMILSAAVLSILLTAPLGALAIDLSVKKLLTKEDA
jgi:NhaP-type Na+/H+ or K+/H+ antiporter